MTRIVAIAIAAIALGVPGAAHAVPPVIQRDVAMHNLVADADACGDYGVSWDINIVADIADYFDEDGTRLRRVFHIHEDNTVTQIDSAGVPIPGTTMREGPDSFTQTVYFNADGTVDRIVATGLAARIGNELRDVGRAVLLPLGGGRWELAFSAGQHPLREAASGGTIVADALPALCDLFA